MITINTKADFEVVFRQHYSMLCNVVRPMVGDIDTAKDVVQEVMIHLWKHRKKIGQIDHIGAFLITASKRKAIEHIRKTNSQRDLLDAISNTPTQEDANVDHEVLKERINNSIRQLPSKCGEVFIMSKVEGLTYTEIADSLGISVKTVENHMVKAFRLLREALHGKLYD